MKVLPNESVLEVKMTSPGVSFFAERSFEIMTG